MSAPLIVCAAISAISAFVSLGFSIASTPNTKGQTRTLALYASARSLEFAIISVVALASGSVQWVQAVAGGMIIVQACDAGIGVTIRDGMKTFCPAGTAIANLAALTWLMNA